MFCPHAFWLLVLVNGVDLSLPANTEEGPDAQALSPADLQQACTAADVERRIDMTAPFARAQRIVGHSLVTVVGTRPMQAAPASGNSARINKRATTTEQHFGVGVAVNADGCVLCACSVVKQATHVRILSNESHALNATVERVDDGAGLAVVRADLAGLPAATLRDSKDLKIGEWVWGHANPLFTPSKCSLTVGVVVEIPPVRSHPHSSADAKSIQMFAGSSATARCGPVFDLAGRLVGFRSRAGVSVGSGSQVHSLVGIDEIRAFLNAEKE